VSHLSLAQAAIAHARAVLPLTDNKWYDLSGDVPAAKRDSYQLKAVNSRMRRLHDWRRTFVKPVDGAHFAQASEKHFGEIGIGNCGEQSRVAYAYLSRALAGSGTPIDVVGLFDPGDHLFVQIGQPIPEADFYPDSFSEWSAEAVICDPWAKIACFAAAYPAEWTMKMVKWSARGMTIRSESPRSERWLLANRKYRKRSYHRVFH
jgi:hypothetical protein